MRFVDRLVPLLFLSSSIVALISAYFAEYILDIPPCELCMYQRIPFLLTIPMSISLFYMDNKFTRLMMVILMLINSVIAGYQVSVENQLITHSEICMGTKKLSTLDVSSVEAIERSIAQTNIVQCNHPSIVVLGISMAGWNIVYCLSIILLYLIILRYGRNEE